MSFYTLWGSLEIGLVFSLVALGVFITFRVLNFPDLTVDGSFPLGAATAAILISTGHNPFLATGAGMLAGAAAGLVTGWLNVRLRIMDLLAGILVMIALYSINLRVMGGPNVPLISEPTVFSFLPGWLPDYVERPLAMLLLVAVLKLLLDRFFASQLGLALRATGANGRMARAQGVNTGNAVLLGMAISNALVGLAGHCSPRARAAPTSPWASAPSSSAWRPSSSVKASCRRDASSGPRWPSCWGLSCTAWSSPSPSTATSLAWKPRT